jgi:hypothetical protein
MQRNTKHVARLTLALAILQFLLVSFEAAGMVHGGDASERYHHENLVTDSQGQTGDEVDSPNPVAEACDHCHYCHGHGSHLAPLSHGHLLSTARSSIHSFSDQQDLQSIFIHSIHRPPIA